MLPVLSRAQMRAFDSHAIEHCHVPSLLLMENAGRGCADVLVRELLGGRAQGARVVIVCGTGNNGGDGLVMARHLALRGAAPLVFLTGDARRVSPDARANLDAWRGLRGELREVPTGATLSALLDAMARADVVVDALFGTGLDRPIDGFYADIVRALNASRTPRLSVDLPSGLDADKGVALGVAVEARVTVTFAHYKLGLLTPQGAQLAGRVHVVDIGVPAAVVGHVGSSAQLLETADIARGLPRRARGAHKTSAGHVVVLGGSVGKIGAPKLVARGAMRAGAGLATIATWPDAIAVIESNILEAMTARIDPHAPGKSVDPVLLGKHCVVVGPGLGLTDQARALVEHVLASWTGPVVVDADALTMFAGRANALTAPKKAILTPHPGELARLLGKTAADVESDRFGAIREALAITKAVVVLKGAHSIIGAPDGRIAVTPIACPALATAGSGDVLGGVVAAVACSLPPFEAACAGVMLHALAGEAWSKSRGDADRGMLASEIADLLPRVLGRITASEELQQ